MKDVDWERRWWAPEGRGRGLTEVLTRRIMINDV